MGIKELPDEDLPLKHRHIYFGHAYKVRSITLLLTLASNTVKAPLCPGGAYSFLRSFEGGAHISISYHQLGYILKDIKWTF